MASELICELQDVRKNIKGTKILNGITFQVRKGSITAILGPNGAGKTSTIRVIMGLLKPTSGKVRVLGIDVVDKPESVRQSVGLLPQTNAGYKSLNGLQNLRFMLELSGRNIPRETVIEYLQRLDLIEVQNKKWGVLSGGEQRALGFIRAILSSDDLLILDEPTTGLDLARAALIRQMIQEEAENGKTIIMSSHVLTDLEELAEEVIIIRKGTVIAQGPKDEIQKQFASDGDLEDALVKAFFEGDADNAA